MASKQFAIPQLDDLMRWHLYIGYCQEDKQKVRSLYEKVRSWGLTCSLRSSLDAEERSVELNVEEGINFSQSCLLYVSPAYINDCWSTIELELEEAERKVKYFGKKAVIAIIEPSVDECHLKRFSQFTQMKRENIFTEACLKEYLSEFELKPILSTFPKSNIGIGCALPYFYGFLQLQLPVFSENLQKAFEKGIADWNCVVKKMLIIIPESVNSPPQMTEPGVLEQTDWTVVQFASRSGREKREYTVPFYKLIGAQESYYFVGDIPACLYAFYEEYERGLAGLTKCELLRARNEFCYTLKGLLNHPDNLGMCANQWEMLIWPDAEENPNRKKLSEFLLQQIEAKKLTEVSQVTLDGSVQATTDRKTFLRHKGIQCSTVYRGFERYQLKQDNRGFCVIINNSKFSNPRLEERTGSDVESEDLKKLFTELHFEVDLRNNLTATEMWDCLKSYQDLDHSKYDAFVCCILSHGVLGSVCATDGTQVKILDLMELFYDDACLSLREKPKLFFIGACQSQTEDGVPVSSGVQETGQSGLMTNAAPDDVTQPAPDDVTQPTPDDMTQPAPDDVTHPAPDDVTQPAPDAVTQPTCYLVPSSDNFIVSYATLPKKVAYAHPECGGLYVKALCKYLREDHEIDVALKLVCSEVRILLNQYSREYAKNQKPFHICATGTKLLFLCG